MEEFLKNIPASKTFSVTTRNPKKFKETEDFFFDDAQRHGVDEQPQAPSLAGRHNLMDKKEQTEIANSYIPLLIHEHKATFSYAEFIAKDRNVYHQRKILLQQEKLQNHTAATCAAASNTKNLDTKGLRLEDEPEEPVKEADVTNWPQCKDKQITLTYV